MSPQTDLGKITGKGVHKQRTINPGDSISVAGVRVTAFSLFHDSPGAQSYRVQCGDICIVLITDTGKVSNEMHSIALGADILLLEANYNEQMLKTGPYPIHIKRRIRSDVGHLSNYNAAEFINDLALSPTLRRVYLCHISAVNNNPTTLEGDLRRHLVNPIQWHICPRGEMVAINTGP